MWNTYVAMCVLILVYRMMIVVVSLNCRTSVFYIAKHSDALHYNCVSKTYENFFT